MCTRALLLALLLGAAWAAPEGEADKRPTTREEVDGKVEGLLALLRQREVNRSQVLEGVQRSSRKGRTPREAALNTYLWALVLEQIHHDEKAARSEYEAALGLFPAFPAAHVAIARLAAAAGDMKEAERRLRQALELAPEYVEAIVLQAKLHAFAGRHEEAIVLFKRAIDVEPTGEALNGIAASSVALFLKSVLADERKHYANQAVGVADAWILMEPENPNAYLMKVQVLQDLGRLESAVEFCEGTYEKAGLVDAGRKALLLRLRALYQVTRHIEGLTRTLKRLLSHDITPELREQIVERIGDLEKHGPIAFLIWEIDVRLKVLENDGVSVDDRKRALSELFDILKSEMMLLPELREFRWDVVRRLVRSLVGAPPGLQISLVQFFRREMPDPLLIRVLVHFLYPHGKTPGLREETVRTLGACAEGAALPALLYCLRDDDGAVAREVDKQLSLLAETRSPVGGGVDPLTPEQLGEARRFWVRWSRTETGGEFLARSFRRLGELVRPDPASTRGVRTAPMVDHAANLLQDNDLGWVAWQAAYEFLVVYWGKEFRPVARRGSPVTPAERPAIVTELAQFLARPEDTPPPPAEGRVPPAKATEGR